MSSDLSLEAELRQKDQKMRSELDRYSDMAGRGEMGEKVKFVLTITFLDLLLTSLGAYALFGHCPKLACLSTAACFIALFLDKFINRTTRTYYNSGNTLYLILFRNLVLIGVYYLGVHLESNYAIICR